MSADTVLIIVMILVGICIFILGMGVGWIIRDLEGDERERAMEEKLVRATEREKRVLESVPYPEDVQGHAV